MGWKKWGAGAGGLFEWYRNEGVSNILADNQLGDFQSVWESPLPSVDTVNYRRSGWSGVFVMAVSGNDKQQVRLFIKRQENHQFHHPWFFWIKRPTFYREYKNLLRADAFPVLTPECWYYGERTADGKSQAIIILRDLEEYESLEAVIERTVGVDGYARGEEKKALLTAVIGKTREFHNSRFQHGGLRAKHIFLKKNLPLHQLDRKDIAFIDMERTRMRAFPFLAAISDMAQFLRGASFITEQEAYQLVEEYVSEHVAGSLLFRLIRRRIERKPAKWMLVEELR